MNGYERTLAVYFIIAHVFTQACLYPEVIVSAYGEGGAP